MSDPDREIRIYHQRIGSPDDTELVAVTRAANSCQVAGQARLIGAQHPAPEGWQFLIAVEQHDELAAAVRASRATD